jgi:hypothetical protein
MVSLYIQPRCFPSALAVAAASCGRFQRHRANGELRPGHDPAVPFRPMEG